MFWKYGLNFANYCAVAPQEKLRETSSDADWQRADCTGAGEGRILQAQN